jgi:hypothetical protein
MHGVHERRMGIDGNYVLLLQCLAWTAVHDACRSNHALIDERFHARMHVRFPFHVSIGNLLKLLQCPSAASGYMMRDFFLTT